MGKRKTGQRGHHHLAVLSAKIAAYCAGEHRSYDDLGEIVPVAVDYQNVGLGYPVLASTASR